MHNLIDALPLLPLNYGSICVAEEPGVLVRQFNCSHIKTNVVSLCWLKTAGPWVGPWNVNRYFMNAFQERTDFTRIYLIHSQFWCEFLPTCSQNAQTFFIRICPTSANDWRKLKTDPDDLLEEGKRELRFVPKSGKSKECICLMCQQLLLSGLVLEPHMKLLHPLSRPYNCMVCASVFNNLWELSSHRANVHKERWVVCK